MDKAEAKIGGKGGVRGSVSGSQAENELPGLEAAVGGAGQECKGVEENSGGGLDPAIRDRGECDVVQGGNAGEGFLLRTQILEAVEGDDEGKAGDHPVGIRRGSAGASAGSGGGGAAHRTGALFLFFFFFFSS